MNWLYDVLSIIIGIIIFIFSFFTYKNKNKLAFFIVSIIHSILFIGFGILGFFLSNGPYDGIMPILAMLAFSITYIIFILTLYKKEPKKKDNILPNVNNDKSKKEDKNEK